MRVTGSLVRRDVGRGRKDRPLWVFVVLANDRGRANRDGNASGMMVGPQLAQRPGARSTRSRWGVPVDHARCARTQYWAPELLQERYAIGSMQYTREADMWAVGVLAHIVLLGKFPFEGTTLTSLWRHIVHGRYAIPRLHGPCMRVRADAEKPWAGRGGGVRLSINRYPAWSPEWEALPAPLRRLIAGLLVPDPLQRLTAEQARRLIAPLARAPAPAPTAMRPPPSYEAVDEHPPPPPPPPPYFA